MSKECKDFIVSLIEIRDKRLGKNGIHEIKEHVWLKDTNWERYLKRQVPSPFDVSVIGDNTR